MWKLLLTAEQISNLKANDLVLQHPSNDSNASKNPTGNEENSNIYRVHSRTASEITLEFLPSEGYIFGNVKIDSMKRLTNYNQLLNGKWWIKE